MELTAQELRELLHYDPETGVFTNRVQRNYNAPAGAVAGAIDKCAGYRQIRIKGRIYRAHRLAWIYVHGQWPTADIDHYNGVLDDNRISNLRDVSQSVNMQNRQNARRSGSSGEIGVHWVKQRNKWSAQISINGKSTYLGYYVTKEEARAAYRAAKKIHHPTSRIAHES